MAPLRSQTLKPQLYGRIDPTDCSDPAVQYNLQGRQDYRSVVYSSQGVYRLRQLQGALASNDVVQHSDQAADEETEGHA